MLAIHLTSPRPAALVLLAVAACGDPAAAPDAGPAPRDPATAPRVVIDRFSEAAATLQVRTPDSGLPGPGEPIDLDQPPFITRGLGPAGESIRYHNLDVQPELPPSMYILVDGAGAPIDQPPIVDVVPGDAGYGDFWRLVRVTVDAGHVANTVTSLAAIIAA